MFHPRPTHTRLALVSAAALGLFAAAGPALALSPDEMITKAKAACLEKAGSDGWRTELAEVVSAKALDTDKVEVIFLLTKDGTSKARLTCPYSVSQGVGAFGGLATPPAAVPAPPASEPVNPGRAWWLLLPIGLGLLSWAWLRGRNEPAVTSPRPATYGTGTPYGTTTTHSGLLAEANARDGLVEVREHPDIASTVLRRVRNGDSIGLTGVRRNDWLEASQGGWVRDIDLRYDRTTARFT